MTELKSLTLNGNKYDSFVDETARTAANEAKELAQNTGGGLTAAQINALDGLFKACAYIKEDVSTEYNAFITAFTTGGGEDVEPDIPEPEITLVSISATYTGGNVVVGTALTELTGITVTATYSDGTIANITDYTLTGTIGEGNNIITVSYGGKTTTFTVVGVADEEENAVVYNVFDGEYVNSGYSGEAFDIFGSNKNVYQERIDISNADKLYWRIARVIKSKGGSMDNSKLAIYASDGTLIEAVALDSSVVTTEETYGVEETNVGYTSLGTDSNGKDLYTKNIGSISLVNYADRAYALFVMSPHESISLAWEGNAQSTSPLTLEGWV